MTAEIYRFPLRKPALRVVHSPLDCFGDELIATAGAIQKAAEHLVSARAARFPEASVTACTDALEEALFRALTIKGCSNHDLPLRRMLVSRFHERSRTDG